MAGSKKFFHDRTILLLTAANSLLASLGILSIILRLGTGAYTQGLIGEYRSNLGLSAFRPGDSLTFVGFIIFIILTLAFHIFLGRRVYHVRRDLSLAVMSLGTLLIVLAIIVSNSLLGL